MQEWMLGFSPALENHLTDTAFLTEGVQIASAVWHDIKVPNQCVCASAVDGCVHATWHLRSVLTHNLAALECVPINVEGQPISV